MVFGESTVECAKEVTEELYADGNIVDVCDVDGCTASSEAECTVANQQGDEQPLLDLNACEEEVDSLGSGASSTETPLEHFLLGLSMPTGSFDEATPAACTTISSETPTCSQQEPVEGTTSNMEVADEFGRELDDILCNSDLDATPPSSAPKADDSFDEGDMNISDMLTFSPERSIAGKSSSKLAPTGVFLLPTNDKVSVLVAPLLSPQQPIVHEGEDVCAAACDISEAPATVMEVASEVLRDEESTVHLLCPAVKLESFPEIDTDAEESMGVSFDLEKEAEAVTELCEQEVPAAESMASGMHEDEAAREALVEPSATALSEAVDMLCSPPPRNIIGASSPSNSPSLNPSPAGISTVSGAQFTGYPVSGVAGDVNISVSSRGSSSSSISSSNRSRLFHCSPARPLECAADATNTTLAAAAAAASPPKTYRSPMGYMPASSTKGSGSPCNTSPMSLSMSMNISMDLSEQLSHESADLEDFERLESLVAQEFQSGLLASDPACVLTLTGAATSSSWSVSANMGLLGDTHDVAAAASAESCTAACPEASQPAQAHIAYDKMPTPAPGAYSSPQNRSRMSRAPSGLSTPASAGASAGACACASASTPRVSASSAGAGSVASAERKGPPSLLPLLPRTGSSPSGIPRLTQLLSHHSTSTSASTSTSRPSPLALMQPPVVSSTSMSSSVDACAPSSSAVDAVAVAVAVPTEAPSAQEAPMATKPFACAVMPAPIDEDAAEEAAQCMLQRRLQQARWQYAWEVVSAQAANAAIRKYSSL
jgi:hypothetical protein